MAKRVQNKNRQDISNYNTHSSEIKAGGRAFWKVNLNFQNVHLIPA